MNCELCGKKYTGKLSEHVINDCGQNEEKANSIEESQTRLDCASLPAKQAKIKPSESRSQAQSTASMAKTRLIERIEYQRLYNELLQEVQLTKSLSLQEAPQQDNVKRIIEGVVGALDTGEDEDSGSPWIPIAQVAAELMKTIMQKKEEVPSPPIDVEVNND